jgi:hypothetical protein
MLSVEKMQARHSLYAEYAECVGHQVPGGAPKLRFVKKQKIYIHYIIELKIDIN